MNTTEIVTHIKKYREILLSNLIIMTEIPAYMTESTISKATAVANRLSEYELLDISIDEIGNVIAIIPGKNNTTKHIALVSHLDTIHPSNIDHTVRIESNKIIAPGLTDNNLGVATLVTLPYILRDMDIHLESNLVLCFSANSMGLSNLKGTRFFLDCFDHHINYGICVEGYPLGRISYKSIGTHKQQVSIVIPEEYDWTRFGSANAILDLNNLMNTILEIPIPSRPKTSIVFNSVQGGMASNIISSSSFAFEIRSESNEIVYEVSKKIEGIVKEKSSMSGADITLETISQRNLGGLDYMNPMVQSLVSILDELDITHRITPSTSDLSAFIDHNIPAVTLGLTICEKYNQEKEIMYFEPMYKGLAQFIAFLLKTDVGYLDV